MGIVLITDMAGLAWGRSASTLDGFVFNPPAAFNTSIPSGIKKARHFKRVWTHAMRDRYTLERGNRYADQLPDSKTQARQWIANYFSVVDSQMVTWLVLLARICCESSVSRGTEYAANIRGG